MSETISPQMRDCGFQPAPRGGRSQAGHKFESNKYMKQT